MISWLADPTVEKKKKNHEGSIHKWGQFEIETQVTSLIYCNRLELGCNSWSIILVYSV